jgi:hypothetical protein
MDKDFYEKGDDMKRSLGLTFALSVVLLGSTLVPSAFAQALPTPPDPALAAVFAAASLQQAPQSGFLPQPIKKCGPICIPRPVYTTATISGSGSSCTAAESSLSSQLHGIALTKCQQLAIGVCNFVETDTTSCTLIAPGTYQIQGYAKYQCSDTTC